MPLEHPNTTPSRDTGKTSEQLEPMPVHESSATPAQVVISTATGLPRSTGTSSQAVIKMQTTIEPSPVHPNVGTSPTAESIENPNTRPLCYSFGVLVVLTCNCVQPYAQRLVLACETTSEPLPAPNDDKSPATPSVTSGEVMVEPRETVEEPEQDFVMTSADFTNYALFVVHVFRNGGPTSLLRWIFFSTGALAFISTLPLGRFEPALRFLAREFLDYQLREEILGTAFALLSSGGFVGGLNVVPFFLMSILPGKCSFKFFGHLSCIFLSPLTPFPKAD